MMKTNKQRGGRTARDASAEGKGSRRAVACRAVFEATEMDLPLGGK